MKARTRYVWVVYFVGFDDTTDSTEQRVEPYVGKDRVLTTESPEQTWQDVGIAVAARGGHLLTICGDDERNAELVRQHNEDEILRRR